MLLFTLVADLEDTTRLALRTREMNPRLLTNAQIRNVISTFNVAWDE
jgi:3-dehydro-4-phosphotetronate decarboxylase